MDTKSTKSVSCIYSLVAEKYRYIHYEEGYEKNKHIAYNLLNNPMNKINKYIPQEPSAPRGCKQAVCPKTFCKFVDSTPR
jgi:hypothetical protein